MELLPKEIAQTIPDLYEQEHKGEEAVVYLKFFDPCSNWTWYAVEYDGKDIFFGLVIGQVAELGYFSLKELGEYKNHLGIGIERDLYFTLMSLKEVRRLNST